MTDAEFSTQQKRVQKAYHRWHSVTGLGAWIVSHEWHRDNTSGRNGHGDRCGSTAQAKVAWEYLHVTFKWNLVQIANHNDHELDRIVRHEICHVLVNEMRMWGPQTQAQREVDNAMMHEERTVSELAAVLRWVRLEGENDAKKKLPKKGKRK